MTAAYKKRAKAGWNSGKAHKEASNRSERIFESQDIAEHGREVEKPLKAKKKPSSKEREIKKLLDTVKWAIKFSRGNVESLNVHGDGWLDRMKQADYQAYLKAVPALREILGREDLDNKLRRQIEETLEKV